MSFERGFIYQQTDNGLFVAQRLRDRMAYGLGPLTVPAEHANREAEDAFARDIMWSLDPVAPDQSDMSSCTDGRVPNTLADGSNVPVRLHTAGASLGTALYTFDALGLTPDASAEGRTEWTGKTLKELGFAACAHLGCKACADFVEVAENVEQLSTSESTADQFIARQRSRLVGWNFNQGVHRQLRETQRENMRKPGFYNGLSLDTFLQVAKEVSGETAIASYVDDGRGVHGHVEEAVAWVEIDNMAVNEGKLAQRTGGRETFSQNGQFNRALSFKIAQRWGGRLLLPATMAQNEFVNGVHGSLVHNVPTYRFTRKSR